MSAFQTLQRDSGILIVHKTRYLLLQLCIFSPFRCKGKGIPRFPCLELLRSSSSSSSPPCFGFRHRLRLSQPANECQALLRKPSIPPQKPALCHIRPEVGPCGAWGLSPVGWLLGHPRWEPQVRLWPRFLLCRQGLELLIKLEAVNSRQIILASQQQPTLKVSLRQ